MNLYPHAKNEALSLSFFLEIQLIQKSCNLIGQKHFGPYLWSQISQKIWDLCKNITNKSPDLPHSTSYSFVTQCQNLKKINALLPRKHLDKQAAMHKDRIVCLEPWFKMPQSFIICYSLPYQTHYRSQSSLQGLLKYLCMPA